MCQITRYPAAYLLRSVSTKSIVKALAQFISIFVIPKIIQTDKVTNFSSRMFAEVLQQLHVKPHKSTAIHRLREVWIHQTLKQLLRSYCIELNKDWEEGHPWLMLAAREVTQDSLGFSPNDLVFGHAVRGPLATLFDEPVKPTSPQICWIMLMDFATDFCWLVN